MINIEFGTPVYDTKIRSQAAKDTAEYILINYNSSNKKSSNVSGDNIFDDEGLIKFKNDEVIPTFKRYCSYFNIDLEKRDYDLRGWVTGYGTNYAMPKHNHSGSHLSAVFYLLCEETNGGDLVLHDPRTNANRGYKDEFLDMFKPVRITPKTGQVIMFPSFMYHNVETFNGKMRLAMPVDLIMY